MKQDDGKVARESDIIKQELKLAWINKSFGLPRVKINFWLKGYVNDDVVAISDLPKDLKKPNKL